jgi:hypothetical protein
MKLKNASGDERLTHVVEIRWHCCWCGYSRSYLAPSVRTAEATPAAVTIMMVVVMMMMMMMMMMVVMMMMILVMMMVKM